MSSQARKYGSVYGSERRYLQEVSQRRGMNLNDFDTNCWGFARALILYHKLSHLG